MAAAVVRIGQRSQLHSRWHNHWHSPDLVIAAVFSNKMLVNPVSPVCPWGGGASAKGQNDRGILKMKLLHGKKTNDRAGGRTNCCPFTFIKGALTQLPIASSMLQVLSASFLRMEDHWLLLVLPSPALKLLSTYSIQYGRFVFYTFYVSFSGIEIFCPRRENCTPACWKMVPAWSWSATQAPEWQDLVSWPWFAAWPS